MAITLYEIVCADDARFSPYAWRSRLALAHKGLEAEFVPCRFTDKAKIAFSGQDKTPILIDDGQVVCDSWSIACYLEEHYPHRPSLFGGSAARQLARFINHRTDTQLNPALFRLLAYDIYLRVDPVDREYFRRTREARLGRPLEQVHAERDRYLPALASALVPLQMALGEQPFLSGRAPAYADYIVMGTIQWTARASELPVVAENAPLYAWRERMLDLHGGYARTRGLPQSQGLEIPAG
jgi:glutathione S-transferase